MAASVNIPPTRIDPETGLPVWEVTVTDLSSKALGDIKQQQIEDDNLWRKLTYPYRVAGEQFLSGVGTFLRGVSGTGEALGLPLRPLTEAIEKHLIKPTTTVEEIFRKPSMAPMAALEWVANQIPIMGSLIASGAAAGPIGSLAAAYMLNAGNVYADLRDKGVDAKAAALAAGIPMSLMEVIVPLHAAGKLKGFAPKWLVDKLSKRPFIGAGLTEGAEEVGQEAIQVITEALYNVADDPATIASRMLNSFVQAGLTGGLLGGGAIFARPETEIVPEEVTEEPVLEGAARKDPKSSVLQTIRSMSAGDEFVPAKELFSALQPMPRQEVERLVEELFKEGKINIKPASDQPFPRTPKERENFIVLSRGHYSGVRLSKEYRESTKETAVAPDVPEPAVVPDDRLIDVIGRLSSAGVRTTGESGFAFVEYVRDAVGDEIENVDDALRKLIDSGLVEPFGRPRPDLAGTNFAIDVGGKPYEFVRLTDAGKKLFEQIRSNRPKVALTPKHEEVYDALVELTPAKNVPVVVDHIRAKIPDLSKKELDKIIVDLAKSGRVHLVPAYYWRGLPKSESDILIKDELGNRYHSVLVRTGGLSASRPGAPPWKPLILKRPTSAEAEVFKKIIELNDPANPNQPPSTEENLAKLLPHIAPQDFSAALRGVIRSGAVQSIHQGGVRIYIPLVSMGLQKADVDFDPMKALSLSTTIKPKSFLDQRVSEIDYSLGSDRWTGSTDAIDIIAQADPELLDELSRPAMQASFEKTELGKEEVALRELYLRQLLYRLPPAAISREEAIKKAQEDLKANLNVKSSEARIKVAAAQFVLGNWALVDAIDAIRMEIFSVKPVRNPFSNPLRGSGLEPVLHEAISFIKSQAVTSISQIPTFPLKQLFAIRRHSIDFIIKQQHVGYILTEETPGLDTIVVAATRPVADLRKPEDLEIVKTAAAQALGKPASQITDADIDIAMSIFGFGGYTVPGTVDRVVLRHTTIVSRAAPASTVRLEMQTRDISTLTKYIAKINGNTPLIAPYVDEPHNVLDEEEFARNSFIRRSAEVVNSVGRELVEVLKTVRTGDRDIDRRLDNLDKAFVGFGLIHPLAVRNILGIFGPLYTDISRFVAFINPAPVEANRGVMAKDPAKAASYLLDTILHELVHIVSYHGYTRLGDYDELFAVAMSSVWQSLLGQHKSKVDEWRNKIVNELYAEPGNPGTYRKDVRAWIDATESGSTEFLPIQVRSRSRGQANQPKSQGPSSTGRLAGAKTVGYPDGPPSWDHVPRGDSEEAWSGDRGDWPSAGPKYLGIERVLDAECEASQYGNLPPDDPEVVDLSAQVSDKIEALARRQVPRSSIKRFNTFLKLFAGIRQMQILNPESEGLRSYVEHIASGFMVSKTSVLREADDILKQWAKLSKKRSEVLSDFIFHIAEKSFEEKRRLTREEITDEAARMKVDSDLLDLYFQIDQFFRNVLDRLEAGMKKMADEMFPSMPDAADIVKNQVTKDMNALRGINFFPFSRFGKWTVVAKARSPVVIDGKKYKKGQTVYFSANESRLMRKADFIRVSRMYKNYDVEVYMDYLPDFVEPFLNFSPTLFALLSNKLGLNVDQLRAARDIMYRLAPGQGFVKHMLRRKGTPGFSRDARRVFASYAQHAANHIARVEWRYTLEMDIKKLDQEVRNAKVDKTKVRRMKEYVEKHYTDVMNPTNDFQTIRGALWLMYFSLVPVQALMNLTEVPIFTYPYLSKRFGYKFGINDHAVRKALIEAYTNCIGDKRLPADVRDVFTRLYERGLLDQSYATEVGAAASQGWLSGKYFARTRAGYYWRMITDLTTYHFSMTEKYNRRVTAYATYRLARQHGLSHEQALAEAEQALNITQGDYSYINRPEIMRGKKSVLFVFKMYIQKSLFYAATNQGGLGYLVMQMALAGASGLPLAEELMALLTFLFSAVTGRDINPENEIRIWADQLYDGLSDAADLFFNGLARYSFGPGLLDTAFGIPFPSIDVSAKVQMGKIINLQALFDVILGKEDVNRGILDFMASLFGVASSTGLTLSRAALESSPSSLKWIKSVPSAGIRNIARAVEALNTGKLHDSRGEPLIEFDLRSPAHIGEIIGLLTGAQPTRVSRRYEALSAVHDHIRFALARREGLLSQLALAIANDDKEWYDAVISEIERYNKSVDPALRMRGGEIAASVRERLRNRNLRTMPFPTVKKYTLLMRKYLSAYGLQPTPSGPRFEGLEDLPE